MINFEEPMITIVKDKKTNELSIHLNNFDSESGNGYTEEEVMELISHLETGIYHLHSCREDISQGRLFEEERYAEEETISR
tara:strand:+ start:526 stop:768 length:243 start_codon:yes stop_codon:yes gene_type:complete